MPHPRGSVDAQLCVRELQEGPPARAEALGLVYGMGFSEIKVGLIHILVI
jgi:hypothetical protein